MIRRHLLSNTFRYSILNGSVGHPQSRMEQTADQKRRHSVGKQISRLHQQRSNCPKSIDPSEFVLIFRQALDNQN
ncbi:unnamed protein product [Schistosoma mattheei]|uniref:Uncharacterized protein n=1 Tax=Schistosoma mattheei TaxID=31246 RepID=A0A183NNR0_9TREM|nr:unnamed protein product [Schistosoma mattheei]